MFSTTATLSISRRDKIHGLHSEMALRGLFFFFFRRDYFFVWILKRRRNHLFTHDLWLFSEPREKTNISLDKSSTNVQQTSGKSERYKGVVVEVFLTDFNHVDHSFLLVPSARCEAVRFNLALPI